MADRSVSVSVTLSDLEGRDGKGQTFSENLRNYVYQPTKSVAVTLVREGGVSSVRHASILGAEPSAPPQDFWDPLLTPICFDLERPNFV